MPPIGGFPRHRQSSENSDNLNINNALRPIICYSVERFERTILRKNAQKSYYNANKQDLIEP